MRILFLLFAIIKLVLAAPSSVAGTRFTSTYSCNDAVKICASSGVRKVDGFDVYRDCWEWSYSKTCNYPSKNNCRLYEHCYAVANLECLLKDSLGNCVNLKREFSCKSWEKVSKEDKEVRVDLIEKDGESSLICKGVPCIDGNCVDKSYLTNGEMMDSVSKLYMASNMKPGKDYNFNLFAGFGSHCYKKVAGHSNCCPDTPKGWGMQLGAKCTKDEQSLMKLRSKNLCVYVGKENKGIMKTVVKHHFCCFGNILEKVVQVEGRKQLGINFGSGGSPNCRGLTIEEIGKLDFSKMDFSEFINELMVKFTGTYKTPNPQEIASSIENHLNIRKYDDNENNPDNKFTGLNGNIKDDSWEAEEEKRIEAERKQQEITKQEEERKKELAHAQEQKRQRKILKEEELANTEREYNRAYASYSSLSDKLMREGKFNLPGGTNYKNPRYPWRIEYDTVQDATNALRTKVEKIRQELSSGNY